MRIISKFRDYYDGYADYTNGDSRIKHYIRKEEEIEISKYLLKNFENDLLRTPFNFRAAYMIIAGKVYPFVHVYRPAERQYIDDIGISIYSDPINDYYFDSKSLIKRYLSEKEKINKMRKKNKTYGWRFGIDGMSKRDVENFFKTDYGDMTDLCIEFDTPIILISPEDPYYERKDMTYRICKKNVNLKEYGLSKLFSAPEMYQLIDVFVSNVLVKDEMPMIHLKDVEKIQSHGFDKKSSFRHPTK